MSTGHGELLIATPFLALAVLARIAEMRDLVILCRPCHRYLADSWVLAASALWSPSPFSLNNNS